MKLNTIYKGDCIQLMEDIADKSVDMILCDLPYGTTKCKWDVVIPFDKLWKHYLRIIKDNGAIVLTAQQPFTTDLINSCRKYFRYSLVWNKKNITGFLNAKKQPLRQHEDILIFYKKQPIYNPQMHLNKLKRNFEGSLQKPNTDNYGKQKNYYSTVKDSISYPRSIIEQTQVVGNSRDKFKHPTQKPVPLFSWLIRTYTNPGAVVLDNCSGSGTTAIACIQEGRNFICMENDEKFHLDSLERVANELSIAKPIERNQEILKAPIQIHLF